MKQKLFLLIIFLFISMLFAFVSEAASLTYVKDTISYSAPSSLSTHSIQFTLTNAVPASGKIVITPAAGYFNIPASFDYTDVDLSVSTGGPYTDRQLASSADSANDGISVVSGTSGSITANLNSTSGLNAGDIVLFELGSNATFGEVGDQSITNHSSPGSFRINIKTKNSSDVLIDSASAMVAIIQPINTSVYVESQAPIISNGLPSGEIPAGSDTVEISLNTDKDASCRYETVAGVDYDLMTNNFTSSSTIHVVNVSGLVDDTAYSFYIRCVDDYNNKNDTDYVVSFYLAETPPPPGSVGQSGGSSSGGGGGGGGGSGSISGGSQLLYLASVKLDGWAYPLTTLVLLKDGEIISGVTTDQNGRFEKEIDELERGAYTFSIYAQDTEQRRSATFSSTLFLGQGTNNRVSDIVIPPTIELQKDTLNAGDRAVVFGESVPNTRVELFVNRKLSNEVTVGEGQKFIATSTIASNGVGGGRWEISFDTTYFEDGTYEIKARNIVSDEAESSFSKTAWLGIGGEPELDLYLRADLNKDGKVNLVDFSILLVYWNSDDDDADINLDGTVGLADFSVMLYYWTG